MKVIKIFLLDQPITKGKIRDSLNMCYDNIAFSTFPYIMYKIKSSKVSLERYNSGNCIALSSFLQKYLKNNYGIISYIIPASVPIIYQVENSPEICHVALLIPITSHSFYIIDPAFYFMEPILCDLNEPDIRQIDSMNIHSKEIAVIKSQLVNATAQGLLPQTLGCKCWYESAPNDTWFYYTNEVKDPDESIGSYFIRNKPDAFLCKTRVLPSGEIYKDYHLKMEDQNLIIIKNHKEIYKGKINEIPEKLQYEIHTKLFKYFSNFMN
jgi:hypothetical protein